MKECSNVLIQFNAKKLGVKKLKKIMEAEKLLLEAGISFDTGIGFGFRDWSWDFSLKGPVKIYIEGD